jgi:hypothetical protein
MRALLLDTDILLILSGLDLFDTAIGLFEAENAQVYVLDAVQYQIKGKKFQNQLERKQLAGCVQSFQS